MANHKIRTGLASVGLAAAATATAALSVALIGAGSAGAYTPIAPGKSVSPRNADVLGKCSLTVQSVNPSDGTVTARVAGQAQPGGLLGYATNVYTQVFCTVYDSHGNLLTRFSPFANNPVLVATNETATIAYDSSYTLCGTAVVKKNNGATSTTAQVCA